MKTVRKTIHLLTAIDLRCKCGVIRRGTALSYANDAYQQKA